MRRLLTCAGPSLALLLASALGMAAPTKEDVAAAKERFDQAKMLALDGKWSEACVKLDESRRLDPKMLTIYRLADCHEHIGKTASAWKEFLEAADLAKAASETIKAGDATERARKLEAKLTKLSVVVDDTSAGLTVTQDGATLSKEQYGVKVAVDPGEHVVAASAPGKKPFEKKLVLGAAAEEAKVVIPHLEDEGVSSPPTPEPVVKVADKESTGFPMRTIGLVTVAVGVVGLGVGTWLALSAKSKNSDADAHCLGTRCDVQGKLLSDDARNLGNFATVAFGIGAVAIVSGAVLWLTAPEPGKSSAWIAPSPLFSGAAITLGGRF